MRAEHPVFQPPEDPEAKVWRYFDFPKFVSMLKEESLYFCRADLLGDPLEGSFTRAREAERQRLLADPPEGRTREDLEAVFRHIAATTAAVPPCAYVNCWHQGDHESMAMWRGYGGGPYGVAIRSTARLLDQVLPERFGPNLANDIYIGQVRYLDYESVLERVPEEQNAYAPFVCKSVVYQHEHEVRAVLLDLVVMGQDDTPRGRLVPVDLPSLVEHVTVSPLAPDWFESVVGETCKRFGYQFAVGRSTAWGAPIY